MESLKEKVLRVLADSEEITPIDFDNLIIEENLSIVTEKGCPMCRIGLSEDEHDIVQEMMEAFMIEAVLETYFSDESDKSQSIVELMVDVCNDRRKAIAYVLTNNVSKSNIGELNTPLGMKALRKLAIENPSFLINLVMNIPIDIITSIKDKHTYFKEEKNIDNLKEAYRNLSDTVRKQMLDDIIKNRGSNS